MIRVPRPRIVSVRRRSPGQISPGDLAEVRLEPGIIAFLEACPYDDGVPIGTDYHARYNVPAGLAASAAMAVLAPGGTDWAGRDLEIEWLDVPDNRDTVLVEARLEESSVRIPRFTLSGRTLSGKILYRGSMRLVRMQAGYPAGFRSAGEYHAVRERLAQALTTPSAPPEKADRLRVVSAPGSIALGRSALIEVEVANREERPVAVVVKGRLPFGHGLSFNGAGILHAEAPALGSVRLGFSIRADRPHEVNLGKPWELAITAESAQTSETVRVSIHVPDPNPGRTFYLLTEDCETFDGGPSTGDYSRQKLDVYGNRNNFMDPEEYRIQMIRKPERLNQIAERHGARWTHFYAATQRFAAEWAAGQSGTGEWNQVIAEMDESVRAGSRLHEYCPHIHFDYEPDSTLPPRPRLLYDSATDGILPNDYYHPESNPTHRYHDWDGSARGISYIKRLGDWTDLDSKAGSLRKSLLHLARLQANRRAPLVGRTGSYDFGQAPEDQAVSTHAYLANGLYGNSDACDWGAPPSPGGQMYWCAEQDRRRPIGDLREARLVQFGLTMDTLFRSAEEMNRWFARQWPSAQGPGVHAILFTSHAMFFAGAPDPFRSLSGGAFEELDQHLTWIRQNYPEVEFATATEALLEFLDYYTPVLTTYTEPLLCDGDPASGRYEFPVRLLGQGIRVDEGEPASVQIVPPPCFSPAELQEIRVKQDGHLLQMAKDFDPGRQPAVTVKLTSRAPLRVEVVLRAERIQAALEWFREAGGIGFFEAAETRWPDLFRVRPAIVEEGRWRIFSDVARFLMNPVAGHTEPLGRRIHPLGAFSLGASLAATAAQSQVPSDRIVPVRLKLRWLHQVDLDSTFTVNTEVAAEGTAVRIADDTGTLVAVAEVVTKEVFFTEYDVRSRQEGGAGAGEAGMRAWAQDFEALLAVYRSQRAWKLMLAARKGYSLLISGGWKALPQFLVWMARLVSGRPAGLQEFELQFPQPKDYLR